MTPQEHARDLLLRLAAIRPEGPDDISSLLVMSFEDAISAERAINAELVEVLTECADDLENEVEHRYKDTKDYPSEKRHYERDIAPVRKARAALARARGET